MSRSWLRSPQGGLLWIGLFVLGLVLLLTSISGVFIVDEDHHLAALRSLNAGSLTVPEYEGLEYSAELAAFDPACRHRAAGNITTAVPPLYAFVALPFYQLGWKGLVALNILSFLACAAMVFFYARWYSKSPGTPWLALATFLLASYSIEYAQGLWPHMLAVALCVGGVLLASRVRDGGPVYLALVAGLLTGLATGIRYQNIVFAGAVGLGLFIWARRRVSSGGLYLLGFSGPLLASSVLNYLRYENWNPISKGSYYLTVGVGKSTQNPLIEALAVFWAKIVDFSAHPPLGKTLMHVEQLIHPEPDTGAYLMLGKALKKAWIQSSPWLLLVLVALVLAWRFSLRANFENRGPNLKSRELRSMFLIIGCVLGAFSLAGFQRFDGLCFNQRYFLELMPLAAVALAWFVEGRELSCKCLLSGCVLGAILAAGPLVVWDPGNGVRQLLLLKLPLLLAGFALIAWILSARARMTALLPVFLGACLSWSLVIHLGEDLATTNFVRGWRKQQHDAVAGILPEGRTAVFAYWGYKDGLGPLHFDHDVIIADPWIDEGRDAWRLTGELLATGRRVFVLAEGMPKRIFDSMAKGRRYRMVTESPYPILEIAVLDTPR